MPRTRDGRAAVKRARDIAPTRRRQARAPRRRRWSATTRAVNVEAFMPCSAADVQYASTALTWSGSGSPRQRRMKRSVIVLRLVDLALRHHRQHRARGLPGPRSDSTITAVRPGRRRASVVADVVQRPHAPGRRDHRDRALDVDTDVAGVHRDRVRLGGRQAGLVAAVDEKPPHPAERDTADQAPAIPELNEQTAATAGRRATRGRCG